jgi:hypothetical protein
MTVVHMLEATAQAAITAANKPAAAPVVPEPDDEPVVKTSVQNFTLAMPETMKQHLTQRVELPSLNKIAKAMEDTAARSSLSIAAVIANVMNVSEKIENRTNELRELAMADRMAIFNDKGEPVGTRIVLKDDLHATH